MLGATMLMILWIKNVKKIIIAICEANLIFFPFSLHLKIDIFLQILIRFVKE